MTIEVVTGDILESRTDEVAAADGQWAQIVHLSLIPHPKVTHQEAIEADYRMKGRRIEVSCRAAIAGYMLRRWGVDCSLDSSLNPEEYHLALQNIESLASADSRFGCWCALTDSQRCDSSVFKVTSIIFCSFDFYDLKRFGGTASKVASPAIAAHPNYVSLHC